MEITEFSKNPTPPKEYLLAFRKICKNGAKCPKCPKVTQKLFSWETIVTAYMFRWEPMVLTASAASQLCKFSRLRTAVLTASSASSRTKNLKKFYRDSNPGLPQKTQRATTWLWCSVIISILTRWTIKNCLTFFNNEKISNSLKRIFLFEKLLASSFFENPKNCLQAEIWLQTYFWKSGKCRSKRRN